MFLGVLRARLKITRGWDGGGRGAGRFLEGAEKLVRCGPHRGKVQETRTHMASPLQRVDGAQDGGRQEVLADEHGRTSARAPLHIARPPLPPQQHRFPIGAVRVCAFWNPRVEIHLNPLLLV